jgi:tRNA(Ile)-lysidine synthase
VVEFITRYNMFARGARVGVAVSGGADSVCLLHILLDLAEEWNLSLSVLHLNHKLRGEESDRDEQFVREMAGTLKLPAIVHSWKRDSGEPSPGFPSRLAAAAGAPLGPGSAPQTSNLEESAREARLAFFAEAITSGAVERVALGHTRSDQAETVLFRFLRGAGTAGLAGIRPVTSGGIVRPLLAVERSEVEAFLRARGIAWREDASNRSLRFARNRIRHELLPLLAREWNPSIGKTLSDTADWALAEEAYWEEELARLGPELVRETEGGVILDAVALRRLAPAAARRMVRHAMARGKGDLRGVDFSHIAAVVQLAMSGEGSGRLQAPGLDIFRSFDWLRFAKPGTDTLENRNYSFPATVPGWFEIPGGGGEIQLELVERIETSEPSECVSRDSVYNKDSGSLDWESLAAERDSGALELRNWRPGDRYQPVGRSAEEKIKSLFQEERVPLWERRHWPVLAGGSSILWARRFGPAQRYAARPGARAVLAIRDSHGGGPIAPSAGRREERESR